MLASQVQPPPVSAARIRCSTAICHISRSRSAFGNLVMKVAAPLSVVSFRPSARTIGSSNSRDHFGALMPPALFVDLGLETVRYPRGLHRPPARCATDRARPWRHRGRRAVHSKACPGAPRKPSRYLRIDRMPSIRRGASVAIAGTDRPRRVDRRSPECPTAHRARAGRNAVATPGRRRGRRLATTLRMC
jgi:hypothetical protein